jgi:hypothetical protein
MQWDASILERLVFVRDDNGGFLQINQARSDPLFEFGKSGIDFLSGLDEFDLDGQVIGDLETGSGVNTRSGQTFLTEPERAPGSAR